MIEPGETVTEQLPGSINIDASLTLGANGYWSASVHVYGPGTATKMWAVSSCATKAKARNWLKSYEIDALGHLLNQGCRIGLEPTKRFIKAMLTGLNVRAYLACRAASVYATSDRAKVKASINRAQIMQTISNSQLTIACKIAKRWGLM